MKWPVCILLLTFTLCAKAQNDTCTGQYDNNKQKHGLWICRDNKHVIKKEHYRHGVLKSYILYNEKGEMIETMNRRGKVKKYTPCGCH